MHKILFYNKFIICLYMFRVLCAHHQEVKIVLYSIGYHHTCRWPSGAQVESVVYCRLIGIFAKQLRNTAVRFTMYVRL